jgi:hypothetical protein
MNFFYTILDPAFCMYVFLQIRINEFDEENCLIFIELILHNQT